MFYLKEAQLAEVLGLGESGASLACVKGRLWIFGGFDGGKVNDALDYLEMPAPHSIESN